MFPSIQQGRNQVRRGSVAVEVALCLPILVVILFGCYEFAHVNMVIHAAESAAYEATRTAIVPGATRAEVEKSAKAVLSSVAVKDFQMTIIPALNDTESKTVTVEVQVPFRKNSTVFRMFVADPVFRGRCQLSREKF
jgi:Flp pilus assembly protein TadG